MCPKKYIFYKEINAIPAADSFLQHINVKHDFPWSKPICQTRLILMVNIQVKPNFWSVSYMVNWKLVKLIQKNWLSRLFQR